MHGAQVEMELLDRDRILAELTPAARSRLSRLEVYPTLDSTNSYLLAQVGADWPSGAVCLAEQQQAGRVHESPRVMARLALSSGG